MSDRGPVIVERRTVVGSPRAEVWAHATSFDGVNAELMPIVRMVPPRSVRGRTIDTWQPGERAACWLLVGGVLPFDRHVLGLESVAPGSGFVESSVTWVQRSWRHERTLTEVAGGTEVHDRVTVEPRLAVAKPLVRAVVERTFRHRHRRLEARFGPV